MLNSRIVFALSLLVHLTFALVVNVYQFGVGPLLPIFVLVLFLSSLSLSVSAMLVFGSTRLKEYLLSRGLVGDVSIASKFLITLYFAGGLILFLATGAVPIRCDFKYLDGCFSSGLSDFSGGMVLISLITFVLWVALAWLGRLQRK
jgi:hypothetical protein